MSAFEINLISVAVGIKSARKAEKECWIKNSVRHKQEEVVNSFSPFVAVATLTL